MEVHHHPDLHHKKKKIREYFLEFLMIFLAVTMGFFAEGIRENITSRAKEREYMTSMLHDLAADTFSINRSVDFATLISRGLDSLSKALYEPVDSDSGTLKAYRLFGLYSRTLFSDFNDQTAVQLRNSGGLQFIKKPNVANAISSYWIELSNNEEYVKTMERRFDDDAEYAYAIFNRSYIRLSGKDPLTDMSILTINPNSRLMTYDKNVLINFANRIARRQSNIHLFFISNLVIQKKQATELITLIRKEYHLENE